MVGGVSGWMVMEERVERRLIKCKLCQFLGIFCCGFCGKMANQYCI